MWRTISLLWRLLLLIVSAVASSLSVSLKSTFQFEFSNFQRNLPDIADSTVVAVVVDSVAEPVVAAVVAAAGELDTVGTDCRLVADRAS